MPLLCQSWIVVHWVHVWSQVERKHLKCDAVPILFDIPNPPKQMAPTRKLPAKRTRSPDCPEPPPKQRKLSKWMCLFYIVASLPHGGFLMITNNVLLCWTLGVTILMLRMINKVWHCSEFCESCFYKLWTEGSRISCTVGYAGISNVVLESVWDNAHISMCIYMCVCLCACVCVPCICVPCVCVPCLCVRTMCMCVWCTWNMSVLIMYVCRSLTYA